MTGKDFLKIILCICGYDRNINISTYRGEDNAVGYRIYGEDKNGIAYSDENCEGLIYNIQSLMDDARKRNASCHCGKKAGENHFGCHTPDLMSQ